MHYLINDIDIGKILNFLMQVKGILTYGHRHNITQAKSLGEGITASALIGDKSYHCDDFVQSLKDQNCKPHIPSKSNSKRLLIL